MRKDAQQFIHENNARWWYDGRAYVIKRLMSAFLDGNDRGETRICDIGAGTGAMLSTLQSFGSVAAFEPDDDLRRQCAGRGYAETFTAQDIAQLVQSNTESFSVAVAFDVIEHVQDDEQFVRHVYKLLVAGGVFFVTVPAFMFLWSEHDVSNQHYRRYSRTEITRLLKENGFDIRHATYWNMALFFPAAIVRLTGGTGRSAFNMQAWLDRIFYMITVVESFLIPTLALPFGTSVIVCATKRETIAN